MTAIASARVAGDGRQGRLMRGYLHKTSNNLCGIKGYASLIAADGRSGLAADWAQRILAEVEQMEDVYRSVQEIAFPRPQAPAGGDLLAAIDAAAAAARARHPHLTVRVTPGGTGSLLLPARDLQLALGELLANAAEAAPTGAEAALAVVAGASGRLAVQIADEGPGVPPALLAEAALPFVTTKPGRLGVGLARVDTLMEMYGLPWSLANRAGGGALVILEVAWGAVPAPVASPGARKGSHV